MQGDVNIFKYCPSYELFLSEKSGLENQICFLCHRWKVGRFLPHLQLQLIADSIAFSPFGADGGRPQFCLARCTFLPRLPREIALAFPGWAGYVLSNVVK